MYESDAVEQHRQLLSLDREDVLAQARARHPQRRPEIVRTCNRGENENANTMRLTFLRRPTLSITSLVSAIPVPILLVIGDNGVVSLETARELQNLNPRLRIEQIQDAGHGLQYDQPERFEVVIRSFLRSVAAS